MVDSGVRMRVVSEEDLNSAELETMRTSRSPTSVMTANGEVQTREEATVHVKELELIRRRLCFLRKLPQCFPCGNSVRIMGLHTTGAAVKNHISPETARELIAIYTSYVPFVVPGLSASSSSTAPSPTSSASSSQDSVLTLADAPKVQYPKEVEVRVRSCGETRCMKPQKPKTKIKMENHKKYKETYYMNCWIGCRISEPWRKP